jgi:hypothetical protein
MTNIETEIQTICNWYKVRIDQLLQKSVKFPHYRKSVVVLKEDFEKAVVQTITNHLQSERGLDKTKVRFAAASLSRIASENICRIFEPEKMKKNPDYYLSKMEEMVREVDRRLNQLEKGTA